MELPVEGFPISDESVTSWFRQRFGRLPGAPEVGLIMDAMALRESTPPIEGPTTESARPAGLDALTPAEGGGVAARPGNRSIATTLGIGAGIGVLALLVAGSYWLHGRAGDSGSSRSTTASGPPSGQVNPPTAAAVALSPGPVPAPAPKTMPAVPAGAQPQSAAQGGLPSVPAPAGQAAQATAGPPAPAQARVVQPGAAGAQPGVSQPVNARGSSWPGMAQATPGPSGQFAKTDDQPRSALTRPFGQDEVRRVQHALQDRGFYHGAIDGRMGPMTEAGVRSFQRKADLPQTTGIDTATVDRLLQDGR